MMITSAEQFDAVNTHRLIADVFGSYNLYHLRPAYVDNDIDDLVKHYFDNLKFMGFPSIKPDNIHNTLSRGRGR